MFSTNSFKAALSVLLFLLFLFSLAFSQPDSLNMRLRGTWECPTDDLVGDPIVIHKIYDYIIMACTGKGASAEPAGDSLWFIDVGDPDSPYTALTYTDTAFTDYPAYIRWFEVDSDSGYLYMGYARDPIHGGEYFRILRLTDGNPPSIQRGAIIDSVNHWSFSSINNGYVWGGDCFNISNPDSPLIWDVYQIIHNPSKPPDGSSSYRVWNDKYGTENYAGHAGWIGYGLPDTFYEPAPYFALYKFVFPASSPCTSHVLGCWRGDYNGDDAEALAISEEYDMVAVGTAWNVHFVSIDSVEDGNYDAKPNAIWPSSSVWDLYWEDSLLYVSNARMWLLNVNDLPNIDTLAISNLCGASVFCIDSSFIYAANIYGTFRIYEIEDSLGIGQQGYNILPIPEFKIFPNPSFAGTRIAIANSFKNAELFDISGRKILDIKSNVIDTSNLSAGIYLLRVNIGNKIISKKILIMR